MKTSHDESDDKNNIDSKKPRVTSLFEENPDLEDVADPSLFYEQDPFSILIARENEEEQKRLNAEQREAYRTFLKSFIAGLDSTEVTIVRLYFCKKRSVHDIATIMDCKEGMIYYWIKRIRTKALQKRDASYELSSY